MRNAIIILLCTSLLVGCGSDNGSTYVSQVAINRWKSQKFSMFIHFGLYSQLGGVWKGQKVTKGYSEQIRAHGQIPKDEYRALAEEFNPVRWNPDSVVSLAKQAGMRSIVITAKHHDGFAMYKSQYSDFTIMKATPYKRDVVGELAAACRKQGLQFGVYFSLIDWNFNGALPISDHNSDSIPPEHHQFNLNQVRELMTEYGSISEIWFDMGKPTYEQSRELAELVKRYQPDCLISGRLWNDQGEFAVMGDNASPDFRMGTLWQTPASMFDETWGYRSWQARTPEKEKVEEKLTALVKVVSNGGNYLLNIGPKGDGSIVEYEKRVLRQMGQWLNAHSAAIYETSPVNISQPTWGYFTGAPGKLYMIITQQNQEGKYPVVGMLSKIQSATLLGTQGTKLSVTNDSTGVAIRVPSIPDFLPVVELTYQPPLDYQTNLSPTKTGYELTFTNGSPLHSYSGKDYYSTKPTVIAYEWAIRNDQETSWNVKVNPPVSSSDYLLTSGGEEVELTSTGTATIRLPAGVTAIQLRGVRNRHADISGKPVVITLQR